jgi:hypothetical protein
MLRYASKSLAATNVEPVSTGHARGSQCGSVRQLTVIGIPHWKRLHHNACRRTGAKCPRTFPPPEMFSLTENRSVS